MSEIINGGCHCGNLHLTFYTTKPVKDLPIRACQCSFCRKHNSRATADPEGRLEVKIIDQVKVSKYQFGHGITNFLICTVCGVYVCAMMEDKENKQILANCIVNALELPHGSIKESVGTHYGSETPSSRLERRRKNWMRAEFIQDF